jgi:acetyltransferase
LTGSDAVADAFFRQKGIIRVNDIENMIDIAALMQRIPNLPKGKKLGVITTSGGGGIVAADEAVDMNLDIPELDAKTQAAIMEVIPDYGSAMNPVDVTAAVLNTAEDFMVVLEKMEANPDIDALVIVVTMITGEPGKNMAEDIVKMSKKTKKPLTVAWTAGDQVMGDNQRVLVEGGVQMYRSPVRAVRAMGSLMNYSIFRQEYMARDHAAGGAADEKTKTAALDVLSKAERSLTESQGKELFSLYEIPCTKEEVATSEEDAVRIAGEIGYPLALKIDSPDILHKTEAGGLKLNITDEKALIEAYNEVLENAKAYDPKAHVNGVLVQEMVVGGTEVIVGVKNDPQFGPTIMFGLGGIFVEILKDVSLRVAPLTKEDAMAMIREIKGYKVLAGARGRAKMDIDAIADVLVKVSRMALALEDQVAELDINPLLVLPEGKGVRVADALVIKNEAS